MCNQQPSSFSQFPPANLQVLRLQTPYTLTTPEPVQSIHLTLSHKRPSPSPLTTSTSTPITLPKQRLNHSLSLQLRDLLPHLLLLLFQPLQLLPFSLQLAFHLASPQPEVLALSIARLDMFVVAEFVDMVTVAVALVV